MVIPRRADIGDIGFIVEVSKCVLNCCMEKLIHLALTEPKCLREPKWLRPRRARAAGQSWIS